MGTNSLQSSKCRSFNLRSFRKSSAGERQEVARNQDEKAKTAEEAVRVQKAAAWQRYTHGVGEAVLPTKRPSVGNSQAPSDDKNGVGRGSKGGESNACNVLPKTTEEPRLAHSPRAASRFKAEASFTCPTPGDPSTPPLYDELELSGLRTHMADFVQRLQHQLTKDNAQSPAVGEHQQSKHPPSTSAPSVSIDRQQSKLSRPVAAASSSDHQLTKPPSSAALVTSTTPLHMRPFSALRRLFCKVISGSITKNTKNSPRAVDPPPALCEPEVQVHDDQTDDTSQYHYHHYVHHHHHHYHYAQSPNQERATIIHSQRRHSESGGIHPHIPSLWEAESDEEEGEAEESAMEAYLAGRRRHSDSFPRPKKAGTDVEDIEALKEEYAKAASPMYVSRRFTSERFSPNTTVSKEIVQLAAGRKDEFDEGLAGMKSRRRQSAEYYQEEASLGKRAGGAYKFGRAAGGGTPAMPVVRRRHSESSSKLRSKESQDERGKLTPSPSARYYVDAPGRHIGLPARGDAALLGCHAARPPLYPQ